MFEFGPPKKKKESFGKIKNINLSNDLLSIDTDHFKIKIDSKNISSFNKDLNNVVDKELLCIEIANFVPVNPKRNDSALMDDPIFLYGEPVKMERKYLLMSIHLDNGKKLEFCSKGFSIIEVNSINET